MSNSYERLKKLIEDMGFSLTNGSISDAEIRAYSSGIESVRNSIESNIRMLMLDVENSSELSEYCRMLSLRLNGYSLDEMKNIISKRLTERYSLCSAEEFDEAFSQIGEGSYEVDNGQLLISDISFSSLDRLGRFIAGYVPFCTRVVFSGNGLTFDQWDNTGKSWNEYDGLGLPFEVIDKLGVNNNE